MAKLKDIKSSDQVFVCDNCKKNILAKDVITMEASDNIEIFTPMMPFIYVNKDGIITGGSKMARKILGDRLLGCPHCKTPHLFGFDLKQQGE